MRILYPRSAIQIGITAILFIGMIRLLEHLKLNPPWWGSLLIMAGMGFIAGVGAKRPAHQAVVAAALIYVVELVIAAFGADFDPNPIAVVVEIVMFCFVGAIGGCLAENLIPSRPRHSL